jgi:hypothetical protein
MHTHVHMYPCIYTHVHMFTQMHMHSHLHTHRNTHTHILTSCCAGDWVAPVAAHALFHFTDPPSKLNNNTLSDSLSKRGSLLCFTDSLHSYIWNKALCLSVSCYYDSQYPSIWNQAYFLECLVRVTVGGKENMEEGLLVIYALACVCGSCQCNSVQVQIVVSNT